MAAKDRYALLILAVSIALLVGVGGHNVATQSRPPVYGYRIVNTYPHDPQAYTQGLIYRDGSLYESTGLNGRSTTKS